MRSFDNAFKVGVSVKSAISSVCIFSSLEHEGTFAFENEALPHKRNCKRFLLTYLQGMFLLKTFCILGVVVYHVLFTLR